MMHNTDLSSSLDALDDALSEEAPCAEAPLLSGVAHCDVVVARVCPISADTLERLSDRPFADQLAEVARLSERVEALRSSVLGTLEALTAERRGWVSLQRDVFNRRWSRLSGHTPPGEVAEDVAALGETVDRLQDATRALSARYDAGLSRNLDVLESIFTEPDARALARIEFPTLLSRMQSARRAKSRRKVGMALYRYLQRVAAKTSPRGQLGWVAQGTWAPEDGGLQQRIPRSGPRLKAGINLGIVESLLRLPGFGTTMDINRDISLHGDAAIWLKTRWRRGGKGSMAIESLVEASGLPAALLDLDLPRGASRAEIEALLAEVLQSADPAALVASLLRSGLLCSYPPLPMSGWTDLSRVAAVCEVPEHAAALHDIAEQVRSLSDAAPDARRGIHAAIRSGLSQLAGSELSDRIDVVREDAILEGEAALSLGRPESREALSLLAAATVRAERRYAHLRTLGEQLRAASGAAPVPLMHAIHTWSQAPEWTESDPNPCALPDVADFLRTRGRALRRIRAAADVSDGEISLDRASVQDFVDELAPYQVSPIFLAGFIQLCTQSGTVVINGTFRGGGTLFGRFVHGEGVEGVRRYVRAGVRRPVEVQGASMFNVNLHEDWIDERTDYPGHHTAARDDRFVPFADLTVRLDAAGIPRVHHPDGGPVDLLDLNVMAQHSLPEVRRFLAVFTCQLQPYSAWVVPRSRPSAIGRSTPRVRLGSCLLHRRRVAVPMSALGTTTSERLLGYRRALDVIGGSDVAFGMLHGASVTDNKPMWLDLRSPVSVATFERFARNQKAETVFLTEALPDPRTSGADRGRRHVVEWTVDMVVQP